MARRCALALLAAAAIAAGCGGTAKDPGGATPAGTRRASSMPAGARAIAVVSRQRRGARLEDWTLQTPALRDPTGVRVLLPAGYGSDPRRRYPALYLLHGADSDYQSWTRYGDAQAITAHAAMIVVMPDGGSDGWYTDWYEGDRPVQPRWETYHVGELVPWIDATYRTLAARRGRAIAGPSMGGYGALAYAARHPRPSRRGRAIAGLSMGGYGALTYAARHPGTFAAAASFSGALEVGSAAAWGGRSANQARWRAPLPISLAARLRSLALVELR